MSIKLVVVTGFLCSMVLLTACGKAEQSAQNNTQDAASEVAISVEQQAAIDSIDQPILDEHNTDVPDAIANADSDVATPAQASAEP